MDNGQMLVICEKPSVAKSLAEALGCTKYTKTAYEGGKYVISWCLGHLVETAQAAAYGKQYVKWDYEELPIIPQKWKYTVINKTGEQFEVLKKLMHEKRFSAVCNACDAGREGELVFRLVYEKAGCKLPMKRLWISSMEESAIREGFDNLHDGSEYDALYQAASARQKADWLVGINGTRCITLVMSRHKVSKVGRVKSPTLAMIVDREEEIREFQKAPFYTVKLETDGLEAVSGHMKDRKAAEKLAEDCRNNQVKVMKVEKEEKSTAPPKLYDLTSLQRDANRLFGFSAKQTLDYTQSLYEKKLCTYPRTDSRFLTDDMDETAGKVLEIIREKFGFASGIDPYNADIRAVLDSRKVTDHYAIIPTVKLSDADTDSLPGGEKKILSLIAARLACATSGPERYTSLKAVLSCAGKTFTAQRRFLIEKGWKAVFEAMKKEYGLKEEEEEEETDDADASSFSNLVEGMQFAVRAKVVEGFTKPPSRYTEATLLAAMEKAGADETEAGAERKGLGTPATRAEIIENIIFEKYVTREKKTLVPTDSGTELVTILPEELRSAKLTADWENALYRISLGKMKAEDFITGIETMVKDLVRRYRGVHRESGAGRKGKEKE